MIELVRLACSPLCFLDVIRQGRTLLHHMKHQHFICNLVIFILRWVFAPYLVCSVKNHANLPRKFLKHAVYTRGGDNSFPSWSTRAHLKVFLASLSFLHFLPGFLLSLFHTEIKHKTVFTPGKHHHVEPSHGLTPPQDHVQTHLYTGICFDPWHLITGPVWWINNINWANGLKLHLRREFVLWII